MQVAPLKQAAPAQSSILTLQSGPAQPLTQMHEKPPMELVQVAPFWHTLGRCPHSSTSCSHSSPMYVGGHRQEYRLISSTHVAPFWHKLPGQSSIFSSQFLPRYPEADGKPWTSVTETLQCTIANWSLRNICTLWCPVTPHWGSVRLLQHVNTVLHDILHTVSFQTSYILQCIYKHNFIYVRTKSSLCCAGFHHTLTCCTSLGWSHTPNFTQTGWQMQKILTEIYFMSLHKNSFPLAECHKTCKHSIILCRYLMYQILPRYDEKCRKHKKLKLYPQSRATYAEPIFTNFTSDHINAHHVHTWHTLFHLTGQEIWRIKAEIPLCQVLPAMYFVHRKH